MCSMGQKQRVGTHLLVLGRLRGILGAKGAREGSRLHEVLIRDELAAQTGVRTGTAVIFTLWAILVISYLDITNWD